MMKLSWERGGEASVISSDGNHVALDSSIPSPPGSSLSGKTAEGVAYQVKVRGCRKLSDQPVVFRIDGRFFNLERAQRDLVLAAMQSEQ